MLTNDTELQTQQAPTPCYTIKRCLSKVTIPFRVASYGNNVHGQIIKEEDVLQHFLTFDFSCLGVCRCPCLWP